MPLITVSTCGTSILTNGAAGDDRKFLNVNANKRKSEYNQEEHARLDKIVNDKREKLLAADPEEVKRFSAELNGFVTFYDNGRGLNKAAYSQNMHYLIHTDTYQGLITAGLIRDWGAAHNIKMQTVLINDLNTKSLEEFKLGINNLIDWCVKTLPGYRSSGYKVIFNLVGGFKTLQGYMQTLGMFYADETIYIFEGSKELLRIPKLPVVFDANAKQAVIENSWAFRKIEQNGYISSDECEGIPDTLLDRIDDKCTMSEWMKILWEQVKESMYTEEILPPMTDNIKITRKAQRAVPQDKYAEFNTAISKLSRYVATKGRENPASLDFKKLVDSPFPESTHEFDLWNDGGGYRAFCHYDANNILIIDSVGMGLGHH